MAYFDGIRIGDRFYVGGKELTATNISPGEMYFYDNLENEGERRCDLLIDFNGRPFSWPDLGQIAYWQPVHIDPPQRPKRLVKKTAESWINFYPSGCSNGHPSESIADFNAGIGRLGPALHVVYAYEVEE